MSTRGIDHNAGRCPAWFASNRPAILRTTTTVNIKQPSTELVQQLLSRSVCRVQMSAVISDRHGIFAWGWNHAGADGFGEHAECCAIRRANPTRLRGASITVAGRRVRTGRPVVSLPCMDCMDAILKCGISTVIYHDKSSWHTMKL
jgi:hypothetical protein